MPILSWQINYSSTFASFFIFMTHNSPVNFNLKQSSLSVKGSHENPNFQNFECSGENLPNSSWHFWKHKSFFFEILHQYPVPSNINPCKFLRFLSARVKIRQIPRVNFERTSQFLFKFCIILQSWDISNLYILSSYIFYVGQKGSIKVLILRLLSALMKIFQISLISFSKPQVSFSSNFALLFSVMQDNSFLLF